MWPDREFLLYFSTDGLTRPIRYVWPTMWGPSYRNSYAICISCQGLAIVMCWIFRQHLKKLNERLEREEAEKGQMRRGFRYLL